MTLNQQNALTFSLDIYIIRVTLNIHTCFSPRGTITTEWRYCSIQPYQSLLYIVGMM